MSKSIALRNYAGTNVGLRLIGAVIPGTRNFNQAASRIFNILCTVGFISGAYYLLGGDYRAPWQIRPMAAITGLTFAFMMFEVGFHHALSGFVSAIVGAHKDDHEFNEHVATCTRRAANVFILLNAMMAWNQVTTLPTFLHAMAPAVYGYFFAMVLGFTLRTAKPHDTGKTTLVDQVLPLAFMALCYVVYTRWIG